MGPKVAVVGERGTGAEAERWWEVGGEVGAVR
jgi:hypothetical protein